MSATPEISVAVPSHDRPLRLRWLLNALAEQTLPRDRWEVIVAHDSAGPETEALLQSHPLAADGTLRHVTLPAGTGGPGRHRNEAWRRARAPFVLFTDDDCRPPADWLEHALAAARLHPDAILQGATRKHPEESAMERAAFYHSQLIRPPTPWAETCNILYPRALLERAGGFLEDHWMGEDTDLALRAQALGADYLPAHEMLTYHSVIETSFAHVLKTSWRRWQDLPFLVRKHPQMRRHYPLWVFWKRTHAWLPLFLAGATLTRRNQLWAVLCVPWLVHATPKHGTNPRGRFREASELPLRLAVDVVEMAALARGSVRHRSLLL